MLHLSAETAEMCRKLEVVLQQGVKAGAVHSLHAAQSHVPRVVVGQIELDHLVGAKLLQVLGLGGVVDRGADNELVRTLQSGDHFLADTAGRAGDEQDGARHSWQIMKALEGDGNDRENMEE